jgi:prepilin-type N-terminal cleavage/methylation domain-containing protein
MHNKPKGSNPEPETGTRHSVSSIKYQVTSFKIQDIGFTLLEILIAIFIFSVIVTTIFASYNSVFSNSKTIDQGAFQKSGLLHWLIFRSGKTNMKV